MRKDSTDTSCKKGEVQKKYDNMTAKDEENPQSSKQKVIRSDMTTQKEGSRMQ